VTLGEDIVELKNNNFEYGIKVRDWAVYRSIKHY